MVAISLKTLLLALLPATAQSIPIGKDNMLLNNNLDAKVEETTERLSTTKDELYLKPNNENFVRVPPVHGVSEIGPTNALADSQLEQLATTNLLTLRFKNGAPLACEDSSFSDELETISNLYEGYVLDADYLEPYEYMNDKQRLEVLESKKDMYLYEHGTEEYANSGGEVVDISDWRYDMVIQVQFKKSNLLKIVCEKIHSLFISETEKGTIRKWSISINRRALTQPGNLYVRGIPKKWDLDEITPLFSKFGPISSLKIICDPGTNQSLGYGFLSYPLGSLASSCIKELNGKSVGDSTLFINYHVERKERERMHRDSTRGIENEKDFKAVFVGNLPSSDNENKLLCPQAVLELFKDRLNPRFPNLTIVSSYFPKKNSLNSPEFKGSNGSIRTSLNGDGNENNADSDGLKNYGFIKFLNHQQALEAISTFHNFYWHGKNLIVNRAVQNKRGNTSGNGQRNGTEKFHRHQSSRICPLVGSTTPNSLGYFPSYFPSPPSTASTTVRSSLSPLSPALAHVPPPLTSPEIDSMMLGFMNPFGIVPPPAYGILHNNRPAGFPLPTREQQESNLYVKYLPLSWVDEDLHGFYKGFGEIISAKIITVGGSQLKKNNSHNLENSEDHISSSSSLGISRGYGFVCFKNPLDASRAILATDGIQLSEANVLHVSFAQKTAKSGSRSKKTNKTTYNPKFLKAMRDQHLNGWQPMPYLPLAPITLAMPPPDKQL